jgi:two-component system cell cycle sensor histidine kinase/response regulator CckA
VSCTNLPKSEALCPHAATLAEDAILEKRVILLVEDEAMVRKVTCEVLQSAGYRVLKARNSAEAMRSFRQHGEEVSLLLTDLVMPGRNGHELAQQLRAMCPGLRTILTSGYPEPPVPGGGPHEAGVFYLPKPFAVQSLLAKVREALGEVVAGGTIEPPSTRPA